ncbi:nucleotidyltransferase family protein [Lentzea sp. BCCO 10_0798]|uniref:Nucleotidyltransferase family protein n=1 Tax=Lentzea kristufekii TaxID=3095430 RepID=A0ABU4TRK5_9PSEU|nr:nucleotidyltransferase family protein [Lentzea sp. BCCO 10_0798]MDX8050918.1 nucleotidyltransferase family protein [Lentzea sp. BCCO 10_0798]
MDAILERGRPGTAELRRLLCWAAGRPGSPGVAEVDAPSFLAALDAHRLDGRFLRRVAREDDHPFPPEVVAAVTDRHEQVRRRVAGQVRTAVEATGFTGEDERLVLLKGFSLYARTGDPLAMRRSGDVDVNASDLGGFVERALRSGFDRHGEPEVLDEYAVLVRPDGTEIEVHSYYPVTYLPTGPSPAEYDPLAHQGAWEQRSPFRVHQLLHADLLAHCTRPTVVPVGTLAVLDPEMLVLVYASHFFCDYVLNFLPLPMATIRLDEVATIVDLTALPEFRPDVFRDLVERYDGHQVVALARTMARDLLGVDPFVDLWSADTPSFLPRDLWWDGVDGFPVDLGWDAAETVVREVGMADLLDRLGAGTVRVPFGGAPARASALTGRPSDLSRFVHRVVPGARFDVDCEFTATEHSLEVRVSMPAAAEDVMTGLSLNFGDHRFEFFYKPAIGHFRSADYSNLPVAENGVVSQAETREKRDFLFASIPWKSIGEPVGRSAPLTLLLGARQQKREWSRMTGGAILPLFLDLTA